MNSSWELQFLYICRYFILKDAYFFFTLWMMNCWILKIRICKSYIYYVNLILFFTNGCILRLNYFLMWILAGHANETECLWSKSIKASHGTFTVGEYPFNVSYEFSWTVKRERFSCISFALQFCCISAASVLIINLFSFT